MRGARLIRRALLESAVLISCKVGQESGAMKTLIRKLGRSHGVIIPKQLLKEIGCETGDEVNITVIRGCLVITPVDHDPRAGWTEDSKALAAAGEDRLVWPDFGSDADKNWKW